MMVTTTDNTITPKAETVEAIHRISSVVYVKLLI